MNTTGVASDGSVSLNSGTSNTHGMSMRRKALPKEGQMLRYCRWADPKSPYVVELETEIADRLIESIPGPQSDQEEFGGLLIGEFAKAAKPTLRIDDFVWIGHQTSENPRFELTPEERIQLSSTRRRLITPTRTVLGFFRTHARLGPLSLSASDRELLEREFRRAIHIALVIRASNSPTAALFVQDERGHMPSHPAYAEFRFDSQELSRIAQSAQAARGASALRPQLAPRQPEPAAGPLTKMQGLSPSAGLARRNGRSHFWLTFNAFHRLGSTLRSLDIADPMRLTRFAFIWRDIRAGRSLLLPLAISCVVLCLLFTLWAPITASVLFRGPQLRISANDRDGMVEVRWDTRRAESERPRSATLIVEDGDLSREIRLSPSELKAGAAAYAPLGDHMRFTLILSFPNSMTIAQSIDWVSKSSAAPASTASDKA